jgi:hypothetical protein
MYRTKHKAIKTLFTNLSVGVNIGLVVFLYSVVILKSDLLESNFHPGCIRYFRLDRDPLTINVNGNKVTLQIPGVKVRENTISYMEELYRIHIKDNVRSSIIKDGVVAGPISELEVGNDNALKNKSDQASIGVPYKLRENELKRWVLGARMADAALNSTALLITVKSDSYSNPKLLNHIRYILQDQRVGGYRLVTPQKDTIIRNITKPFTVHRIK